MQRVGCTLSKTHSRSCGPSGRQARHHPTSLQEIQDSEEPRRPSIHPLSPAFAATAYSFFLFFRLVKYTATKRPVWWFPHLCFFFQSSHSFLHSFAPKKEFLNFNIALPHCLQQSQVFVPPRVLRQQPTKAVEGRKGAGNRPRNRRSTSSPSGAIVRNKNKAKQEASGQRCFNRGSVHGGGGGLGEGQTRMYSDTDFFTATVSSAQD
jgi:hypothetical protein